LAVTGTCFAIITVVNALFGPPMALGVLALNGAVAALLLGCAALDWTHLLPARAWPWLAALCALTMVTVGQVQVWNTPDGASFAYVLLIVVAFAPLTLGWAPAVTAAVPMLLGCVVVAGQWPSDQRDDWVIAAAAAIAIGMALLWLRLRSIDEMAALTAEIRALATRDRLTGAFNRRGIEERGFELVALAERLQQPVFGVFLDIVGLKVVNDRHGHATGDMVIVTVADALRATVRSSDIVGRWGGDEFIVLGMGAAQDPEVFRERIVEQIRTSDIAVRLPALDVSVGTATMLPEGLDAATLISQADEDMYTRRRARADDYPTWSAN
jgi:diguanylate cyclase (GGDEF)-like protein